MSQYSAKIFVLKLMPIEKQNEQTNKKTEAPLRQELQDSRGSAKSVLRHHEYLVETSDEDLLTPCLLAVFAWKVICMNTHNREANEALIQEPCS